LHANAPGAGGRVLRDLSRSCATAMRVVGQVTTDFRSRCDPVGQSQQKTSIGYDRRGQTMKALSIQQPWASLIVQGCKRVETRSWFTHYRGPLVIHAGSRFRKPQWDLCKETPFQECLAAADLHRLRDLPLGCVVGVVTMIDCVPVSDLADTLDLRERCFGDFSDGRYAWLFADPLPCAPVRWVGQLGLFDVADEFFLEIGLPRGRATSVVSQT
jgi:activating signal cointegrator 1